MRMPPSCVPPPTHTLCRVLSFSRFLFYVRQEHIHTGNCDIFVSSTHSGRTAMSQRAHPGTSSDAAFALKQFVRRNSRTKKDAQMRFGSFSASGSRKMSFWVSVKCFNPYHGIKSPKSFKHSSSKFHDRLPIMCPRADSSPHIPPSCRGMS